MDELGEVVRSAQERIEELVAPTREELARVERMIEEHELAIVALRPIRNQLRSAVGHLDPSASLQGRNRKGKRKWPDSIPGVETQDAILQWVRANKDGAEFTARDLIDGGVRSQTVINKALNLLVERELVRVVRIEQKGGPGVRGRRTYRLVH
jgi:hypothetical protein